MVLNVGYDSRAFGYNLGYIEARQINESIECREGGGGLAIIAANGRAKMAEEGW